MAPVERNSWRDLWRLTVRALRGPRALDWQVVVPLAAIGFVAGVQYNTARAGYIAVPDLLHAVGAIAAMTVFLLLAGSILSRTRAIRPGSALVVIVLLLVAGALRGVVVLALQGEGSQYADQIPPQRIVQSTLFIAFCGAILALAHDQIWRYARASADLDTSLMRLRQVRNESTEQLKAYREHLTQTVTAGLLPAIHRCQQTLNELGKQATIDPNQLRAAATAVRSTATDVARPVSSLLTTVSTPTVVDDEVADRPRSPLHLSVQQLARTAALRTPLHPVATVIVTLVVIVMGVVRLHAPVAIILGGVLALLVLSGTKRWVLPTMRSRGVGAHVAVVLVALCIAGIAIGVPSWPVNPDVAQAIQIRWGLLVMATTVVAGVVLAFCAAAISKSQQDLARRRAVLASIEWEVDRLDADAHAIESRLAHIVHTEAQGKLSACALRLDTAAATNEQPQMHAGVADVSDAIAQLRALVTDDLAGDSTPVRETINDGLAALIASWRTFMTITLRVNDSDLSRMDRYDSVANAVVELAGEAIANASKHGAAANVTLDLRYDEGSAVAVLVSSDDGRGPSSTIEPGSVLRRLVAAGGTWHIERREPRGTIATFTIPANY